MGKIYFTSDLHFCHDRDFIYEPRGFSSIKEMDETIVKNWNAIVDADDDIYVLGDLMLNDDVEGIKLIKSLRGRIHIVRGNHDSDRRMELYKECHNVVEITEGQFFRYKGQTFYLSHYPCLCANGDDRKPFEKRIISLCGHIHTDDKFLDMDKGLIYHVELNAHDNTPVCIDTILEDIKTYIKER